jgi:putative toxin-antitoxin system antitoxin component (TIGR02293 family)
MTGETANKGGRAKRSAKTGAFVRVTATSTKADTKTRGSNVVMRRVDNGAKSLEDMAFQILVGDDYEPGTLIARLREGLPFSSMERLQEFTGDPEWVLKVIGMSSRTFLRRKKDKQPLDPITSDRLYRLAKIEAEAIETFGDEATAIDWLKSPNRALGDKPLSLLDTEAGADQVLRVLGRIEHGVYA